MCCVVHRVLFYLLSGVSFKCMHHPPDSHFSRILSFSHILSTVPTGTKRQVHGTSACVADHAKALQHATGTVVHTHTLRNIRNA